MNLEPILRKLIESSLYKYKVGNSPKHWYLTYAKQEFKKEALPDESISQVIDWFYYAVLQCEHENEEIWK